MLRTLTRKQRPDTTPPVVVVQCDRCGRWASRPLVVRALVTSGRLPAIEYWRNEALAVVRLEGWVCSPWLGDREALGDHCPDCLWPNQHQLGV